MRNETLLAMIVSGMLEKLPYADHNTVVKESFRLLDLIEAELRIRDGQNTEASEATRAPKSPKGSI